MRVLRLGFPVIGVTDLERASAFWTAALSLTAAEEWASPGWRTLVTAGDGKTPPGGGSNGNPAAGAGESLVITPECAWPLGVNEQDARAVCRMFYNLTPEQRARGLARRN